MTTPQPTVQMASDALRALATKLSEARRLLGSGDLVDLTPLEHDTRAVCDAVRALPVEDGRALRADLEAMLYDLDSLATELTDRYGPQARRAGGGPARRTLGAAYRSDTRRPGTATDQET